MSCSAVSGFARFLLSSLRVFFFFLPPSVTFAHVEYYFSAGSKVA